MTNAEALYVIALGLAGGSIFRLVNADRITQAPRYWLWRTLNHKGFIAYHLLYVLGCAACLPMWTALAGWLLRDYEVTQAIVFVLAARYITWMAICWLQQTTTRDLPDSMEFPPNRARPFQ